MSKSRSPLVKYRLEMAKATLRDMRLLWEQGGSVWSVLNRAYYAMFYATLALLASIGKGASKHAGVIALFDGHFVKPGLLRQELSKWLHNAFSLRQAADYREMLRLDKRQVRHVVQHAERFVDEVEAFIKQQDIS